MELRPYRTPDAVAVRDGMVPEASVGYDQKGACVTVLEIVHRRLGQVFTLEGRNGIAGVAGIVPHHGIVEGFFLLTVRAAEEPLGTVRALRGVLELAKLEGRPVRAYLRSGKPRAERLVRMLGFRPVEAYPDGSAIYEAQHGN